MAFTLTDKTQTPGQTAFKEGRAGNVEVDPWFALKVRRGVIARSTRRK
jgi:hypothetical protein